MSDTGYVYLITHPNGKGNYKIGLTRNPPEQIKQLSGNECTVLAMVLCADPEKTEDLLHKKFAGKRMPKTEWFDLSREELQEVCDVLLNAHKEAKPLPSNHNHCHQSGGSPMTLLILKGSPAKERFIYSVVASSESKTAY